MSTSTVYRALIIEPNQALRSPYHHFQALYGANLALTQVPSVESALSTLAETPPHFICISTSFSPSKMLDLLEEIKLASRVHLIPIIFVVDWSQKLSRVLGTTWAGKVGILHSLSSLEECSATLTRLAVLE